MVPGIVFARGGTAGYLANLAHHHSGYTNGAVTHTCLTPFPLWAGGQVHGCPIMFSTSRDVAGLPVRYPIVFSGGRVAAQLHRTCLQVIMFSANQGLPVPYPVVLPGGRVAALLHCTCIRAGSVREEFSTWRAAAVCGCNVRHQRLTGLGAPSS